MRTSRRASRMTQAEHLKVLAIRAKKQGISEEDFIKQFIPQIQAVALRVYREVK